MKNKLFAAVCVVQVVILLLTCTFAAAAQSNIADSIDGFINETLVFNEKAAGVETVDEWINTALVSGAGSTSEWYAVALCQSGEGYNMSAYANALSDFAAKNKVTSAVSRQRLALALIACGRRDDPFVSSTANDSIGEQGIASLIFGLHLLNNGCVCDAYSVRDVIDMLLEQRLDDGGWAITGMVSDVDVTAMALCVLAPYYNTNEAVADALDGALELLSNRQLDSGAFKSYGTENPESTSQVIVALCALGVDVVSDARFIKNGSTLLDGLLKFRLDDGSFSHLEGGAFNYTATVQAFYSLIAMQRVERGLGSLFVFDMPDITPPGDASNQPPSDTPSD
ncbi:MAG TPA: terpene cyclase/mutase family protein, partial [Bacillota bacterium]|nr:terpene cyclase/mutase family protein [Bacillota bacterium]